MKKKISIFGSTGSIGETVLKLLSNNKNVYQIYILTGYKNIKKIEYQIKKFKPKIYIIFDFKTYLKIKKKYRKNKILILNSKNYLKYNFKNSNITVSAIPGIGSKTAWKLISQRAKLKRKGSEKSFDSAKQWFDTAGINWQDDFQVYFTN